MNRKNKKEISLEEINLEELEKLILISTQETIDYYKYIEMLKDKTDNNKEMTKTYKRK